MSLTYSLAKNIGLEKEATDWSQMGKDMGQKLNKTAPVKGYRAVSEAAGKAFWEPVSRVASWPFTSATEAAKQALLGKKSTTGVHAGKRLHSLATGNVADDVAKGRLTPVSKEVAEEIMSGKVKGQITKGSVGGKEVFYKTKYRPKGLVGWGLKNPGKAGLAALAAYLLLKPEARSAAGGFAQGLTPTAPKGPTADVQREWSQQQSARPVLQQQAWG